jgi:hypothetical protein
MGEGILLAGESIRDGAAMQERHVINLLESILDELPVGFDFCGPAGAGDGVLMERITVQAGAELAEIICESPAGLGVEIDEDESLSDIDTHGR